MININEEKIIEELKKCGFRVEFSKSRQSKKYNERDIVYKKEMLISILSKRVEKTIPLELSLSLKNGLQRNQYMKVRLVDKSKKTSFITNETYKQIKDLIFQCIQQDEENELFLLVNPCIFDDCTQTERTIFDDVIHFFQKNDFFHSESENKLLFKSEYCIVLNIPHTYIPSFQTFEQFDWFSKVGPTIHQHEEHVMIELLHTNHRIFDMKTTSAMLSKVFEEHGIPCEAISKNYL